VEENAERAVAAAVAAAAPFALESRHSLFLFHVNTDEAFGGADPGERVNVGMGNPFCNLFSLFSCILVKMKKTVSLNGLF
jgi:hypothetical protein